MNRGVDIRRIVDDQGVVAAHLKGKNFFRLPGQLAMQLIAGARAAGEQQAIDVGKRT